MSDKKPLTHSAFARKREGRTAFRWIEIGAARIESDAAGGHNVYVDRLPIGGFSGHIYLLPIGAVPPAIEPERPSTQTQDEEF
jgi:hypothetical protein